MHFKKQVQRMCLRWQTWLALLIGLAIIILQAHTINPMNADRVVNNAFLHLTGFDFTGMGTQIYYLLLPLMCGLAASSTYQEDKRNHRLSVLVSRKSKKQYILSTTASSFIVGGIVGVLPLLIEAGYFFLNYNVANLPKSPDIQIIDPSGWGYNLFMHHILIFWFCTILIVFLFSGLFSLIGLAASYYNVPNGVEIIASFILMFLTILVGGLTGEIEASLNSLLAPTSSNTYFYDIYILLGYFVVITGAITMITWKQVKQDVLN